MKKLCIPVLRDKWKNFYANRKFSWFTSLYEHDSKHHKQEHSIHLRSRVLVMGLAYSLLISSAHAEITFKFQYADAPETGFWDPVYGPARQAALDNAAKSFSSMFGSHFANSGTIVMEARATNDPLSGTMAAASSFFTAGPGTPGFNLGQVIQTKLKSESGVDLDGDRPDGAVTINFGQPWNFDLNNPTPADQYDFYTTIYHEFTHALGFNSSIKESGAPLFGAGSWDTFDSFITDKHGNKIIDPTTFALNQSAWDTGKVGDWGGGGTEGLFFDGPHAVAANGNHFVTLYTPNEWNEGGSVSHLDPRMAGMGETMMGPFSDTGPRTHDYSAVEVSIMTDLGYVPAVPEPETYSMMLAGLALCGWVVRRRKIEHRA
jgi:hypothetical protein